VVAAVDPDDTEAVIANGVAALDVCAASAAAANAFTDASRNRAAVTVAKTDGVVAPTVAITTKLLVAL